MARVIQEISRKISNASRRKIICKFYSRKMRLLIPYESLPEMHFMYFLDAASNVKVFSSQPGKLTYFDSEGLLRSYTPDFRVYLDDDSTPHYVEVKPDTQLDYWEIEEKHEQLAREFASRGARFHVVSTELTDKQPTLSNLKLLHNYGGFDVEPLFEKQIFCLLGHGPKSLADISDFFHNVPSVTESIYCLCFRNVLQLCDINLDISSHSFVRIYDGSANLYWPEV